jgi:hypothetical protein
VAERLRESGLDAAPRKLREPNPRICIWCANKGGEACVTECQKACNYLHLCPDILESWEPGPQLPTFRELSQWTPQERLAIICLVQYHQNKRS